MTPAEIRWAECPYEGEKFFPMVPNDLIGKHYKEAKRIVEMRGFAFRLRSMDGELFSQPEYVDEERILADVDNWNVVTAVRFG